MEGTITNRRYLQQMRKEAIPIIQRALLQDEGTRPHAENVILDVVHDVFGSRVLSNRFPGSFACGHHVHRTWIPAIVSFEGISAYIAPNGPKFRSFNRKLKLLIKRWQVTCCMTQLTTLRLVYSQFNLSMCSHEDHMNTQCPWNWASVSCSGIL